jgi:formylglycine-generating enzyme
MFHRSNNPTYPATVDAFELDRFEITVGRFRRFVEAYPASMPKSGAGAHPLIENSGWNPDWNGELPKDRASLASALNCETYPTWTAEEQGTEALPINCITWFEAFAFCAWEGGRLPTEAEWNYAAAGGNEQREYPWSNPPRPTTIDSTYAVFDCLGDDSGAGICAITDILRVGSKSPKGDGRWDQADLAGSLWEWNLDWYADPYPEGDCQNCANLAGASARVGRGGFWFVSAPELLSSYRDYDVPDRRSADVGARCARTP